MATGGLYGNSTTGAAIASPTAESNGLYGNSPSFGGTYFEWFIFQVSDVQPATPTGGSWSFQTNTGTPPTGWLATPPSNPTNIVWVSIALVNSKNGNSLTWSTPGMFSFASGLPILSGASAPTSGDGQSNQMYIETGTSPQSIWFKESGTWTKLTGSTLYVDLTSDQTIAGTKTFASQIQGSISGNASNVTGVVGVDHGGTGSTTASAARTALGAAASGANSDITSLSGITGGISTADYLQLDTAITPSVGVAKLQWDTTWGGPQIGMEGGNVNLQIGQETLIKIYNNTGSALTDGQVVYVTGSQGQRLTVALAQANADSTSATIIGMVTEPIANNASGFVTTQGMVNGLNTSGASDGAVVYLSPTTAGAWTTTKPVAPQHMVMVGYIVKGGSVGAGSIYVNTQNGYELEELHNVLITSPTSGNTLIYDASVGVWKNANISAGSGVSVTNGASSITVGNTGVLSISGGTTGLTPSTATTGAVTLAGTLAVANGGTGVTTSTGSGSVVLSTSPTLVTPALGTPTSGNFSTGTFTWPTFNQNTTGNAATATTATNVSGGTASVTTLTTSSTVTLNGGTANGVAYLNGSKVLTSGSALTFDGTKLGVGTASPNQYVHLYNAGTADLYVKSENSAGNSLFGTGSSGDTVVYGGTAGKSILFYQGGSEGMRLTSTGLGIGTSSPVVKLHVAGRLRVVEDTSIADLGSSATGVYLYNRSNSALTFGTNDTERMRLDSSGNLGLGVTPSASTLKMLQGPADFVIGTQSNGLYLANNAYYNAGWKYAGGGAPSRFTQDNGTFQWHTAPSGTAGNAISFTQAMTLDASGNLLVGTTSGSQKLVVNGNASILAGNKLYFWDSTNSYTPYISSPAADVIAFFGNSNAERARIDSSGNLLVGTTSATANDSQSFVVNKQGSIATLQVNHNTGAGNAFAAFNYAAGTIGSITQNGTTGVLYNLTSDYRLKNDPQPLTGAKEFVMALQPKKWQWWDGSGEGVGFIAHEFMEVAKYSGMGEKDAVDENGKPVYQSIQPSSSEVMANLVALIQEQQSIIDAQTSVLKQLQAQLTSVSVDVAALKGQA